jgi:hypothetical protein
MVALFFLVLPPPTRPRIPRWFEEEGRERGRNNGDRKVTPRGCESRSGLLSARELLRSSRLGALLCPEETLKELDMGARGRLQGEVRT